MYFVFLVLCCLCSKNSRLPLIKATDHSHYRWESVCLLRALCKSALFVVSFFIISLSLRSLSLSNSCGILFVALETAGLLCPLPRNLLALQSLLLWICCCFAWIVSELIDCFCPTVTKFAGVESSNKLLLLQLLLLLLAIVVYVLFYAHKSHLLLLFICSPIANS